MCLFGGGGGTQSSGNEPSKEETAAIQAQKAYRKQMQANLARFGIDSTDIVGSTISSSNLNGSSTQSRQAAGNANQPLRRVMGG